MNIVIGGVDYEHRLIDYSITLNDSWLGNLVPNEASVILDNTDNRFQLTPDGTIKDVIENFELVPGVLAYIEIEGKRKFTGYISKNPTFSIDQKRITINLQDYWWRFKDLYCKDTVYVNASFLTVLEDIATNMAGLDSSQLEFEDPGLTITYWKLSSDTTVQDAFSKLAQSVGGKIYFDENGKLIFKAGFKSPFTTDTVDTLTTSDVRDLTLSSTGKGIDCVEVSGKKTELSNKTETVWVGATKDEPLEIPEDGLPAGDDEFIAQFDRPVWWLCQADDVIINCPPNTYFDTATYQANFYDYADGILNNPEEVKLKIVNNSGSTQYITDFRLLGRYVKQSDMTAVFPTTGGNEKYKLESELIQDEGWAKDFAEWLYYRVKTHPSAEIRLANFEKGLNYSVGDKIILYEPESNLSHRYVIHEIQIQPGNITIKVEQDIDSYTPGAKRIGLKKFPVLYQRPAKRKLSYVVESSKVLNDDSEAETYAAQLAGYEIVEGIPVINANTPYRTFVRKIREINPNIYLLGLSYNDTSLIDAAKMWGLNGVIVDPAHDNIEAAINYAHEQGLDVYVKYTRSDVTNFPEPPWNMLIPGKDGVITSILLENYWSEFTYAEKIVNLINNYDLKLIIKGYTSNPDETTFRILYNIAAFFSAEGIEFQDDDENPYIQDMPDFAVDYRTNSTITVTDNDPKYTLTRTSPLGEMTLVWDDALTGPESFKIGNYAEYSFDDGYKQLWNPLIKSKGTQWYLGLPGQDKYIAVENGELALHNVNLRLISGNSGFVYTPQGTYMFKGSENFAAAYFWKNVELTFKADEGIVTKTIYIDPPIPPDRLKYFISLKEFRYLYDGETFPINSSNVITSRMDLRIKDRVITNSDGDATAIYVKATRTVDSVHYTDEFSQSGTSVTITPEYRDYLDARLHVRIKCPADQGGTTVYSYADAYFDLENLYQDSSKTKTVKIEIVDHTDSYMLFYSDWKVKLKVTYTNTSGDTVTLYQSVGNYSVGLPALQFNSSGATIVHEQIDSTVAEERAADVKLNVSIFVLSPYG